MLEEGLVLFTEDHQPIIEKAVNDAIEQGSPYSLELKARTAKGNVLWVYTNGRAHYKDGKVVSLSGTIQDIDEMKKTQMNLEEERLKGMLQSRLASLEEISAGIAHEINNPLTVISGNLSFIEKAIEEDQKAIKRVESIKKSCDRITKIVKNLKRFVRKHDHSEFKETFVKNTIVEAVELCTIKAKNTFVDISTNLNDQVKVLCDELEIEQVLINLINNAIDAISDEDSGDKWIKVNLTESGNKAIIDVIDSGPGVPAELIDKLFNPFFTTKEVGKGTGLGLSISKKIIEDHKGEISILKQDGHNCFRIELQKA
jgi:C4-dicarboxylate-specific signal transduction histidine kinase